MLRRRLSSSISSSSSNIALVSSTLEHMMFTRRLWASSSSSTAVVYESIVNSSSSSSSSSSSEDSAPTTTTQHQQQLGSAGSNFLFQLQVHGICSASLNSRKAHRAALLAGGGGGGGCVPTSPHHAALQRSAHAQRSGSVAADSETHDEVEKKAAEDHEKSNSVESDQQQQQQLVVVDSSARRSSAESPLFGEATATATARQIVVGSVVAERQAGVCEHCGKRFFDKATMERHLATRHGATRRSGKNNNGDNKKNATTAASQATSDDTATAASQLNSSSLSAAATEKRVIGRGREQLQSVYEKWNMLVMLRGGAPSLSKTAARSATAATASTTAHVETKVTCVISNNNDNRSQLPQQQELIKQGQNSASSGSSSSNAAASSSADNNNNNNKQTIAAPESKCAERVPRDTDGAQADTKAASTPKMQETEPTTCDARHAAAAAAAAVSEIVEAQIAESKKQLTQQQDIIDSSNSNNLSGTVVTATTRGHGTTTSQKPPSLRPVTEAEEAALLRARIDVVEAATDVLVAWGRRNGDRRRAKSGSYRVTPVLISPLEQQQQQQQQQQLSPEKESKLKKFAAKQQLLAVMSGVQQEKSASSPRSSPGAAATDDTALAMNPFAPLNMKQPHGMWEPVAVPSPGNNRSSKDAAPPPPPSPPLRCEVGGVASASLIGIVVSATKGTMRSKTNPNLPPQTAWQLQLGCRAYQADRVSGRVSMLKNIVSVRVREKMSNDEHADQSGADSTTIVQTTSSSSSPSSSYQFSRGDVLFVRGQMQLHSVYDLAARKWNCNGMCVDVAPGVGEISVVHRATTAASVVAVRADDPCSLHNRVAWMLQFGNHGAAVGKQEAATQDDGADGVVAL